MCLSASREERQDGVRHRGGIVNVSVVGGVGDVHALGMREKLLEPVSEQPHEQGALLPAEKERRRGHSPQVVRVQKRELHLRELGGKCLEIVARLFPPRLGHPPDPDWAEDGADKQLEPAFGVATPEGGLGRSESAGTEVDDRGSHERMAQSELE